MEQMMRVLAIGFGPLPEVEGVHIHWVHAAWDTLEDSLEQEQYDGVLVMGGDGTVRRVAGRLQRSHANAATPLIIAPTGTFNVVHAGLRLGQPEQVLRALAQSTARIVKRDVYQVSGKSFLFAAGNGPDAMYIALSELLRVRWLKRARVRYLLAFVLTLPAMLLWLPFYLLCGEYFLCLYLFPLPVRLGPIRCRPRPFSIRRSSTRTLVELDGDLTTIDGATLEVSVAGTIRLAGVGR